MAGPTKIINQDGKRYEFTPGQGGNLLVRGNRTPPAAFKFDYEPKQRAKVIGPKAPPQYALKTYNGRQVYDLGDK